MKATAILVPPFGLLLAFTVYSPDADKNYKDKLIVDLAAAFPLHLQVCQLMEHMGIPKCIVIKNGMKESVLQCIF